MINKYENPIKTKQKKILLVEDEKFIQKINCNFLEKLGYSYDIAETGKETLKLFNKNNYDLIFLDFNLPDMTGIKILERIRQDKNRNNRIPVIFLTANKHVEQDCLIAGADDFAEKPVLMKKMQQLIEKYTN